MNNQPQRLSNYIDDFVASGLYPGGSGVVDELCYKLWDYDGKRPPDSQCAVYLLMTPTDGSNDGKQVEVYWSVGPAVDFQPDHTGAFVISTTRAGISNSCNWADVNDRLKNTCGLESAHMNGSNGLRALIGGQITLTRVDQKKRDIVDDTPLEPGKKQQARTILVPTRYVGPWESKTAAGRVAPVQQMPNQNPASTAPPPPPQPMYAPAPSNGAAFDVPSTVLAILQENGNMVTLTDLPKHMLNKLVSVTPQVRMAALAAVSAQNMPALAQSLGITFDGMTLYKV